MFLYLQCSGNHPCDLCHRTNTFCEYVPAQKRHVHLTKWHQVLVLMSYAHRGRKRKASPEGSLASPAASAAPRLHSEIRSSVIVPLASQSSSRRGSIPGKSEEDGPESRSATDDEGPASFVKKLFRRDHGPHLTSFSQLVPATRHRDSLGSPSDSHQPQDSRMDHFLNSLQGHSSQTSPATIDQAGQLGTHGETSGRNVDPGSGTGYSWTSTQEMANSTDWLAKEPNPLTDLTSMFQDKSNNELEEFLYRYVSHEL